MPQTITDWTNNPDKLKDPSANSVSIKYKMIQGAIEGYYKANKLSSANESVSENLSYSIGIYPEMGTAKSAMNMWANVKGFLDNMPTSNVKRSYSYFAVFDELSVENEEHFEVLLWTQLHQAPGNNFEKFSPEDHAIHSPNDADYAIDVNDHRVHITALNPVSKRRDRRFPWPVLIFNVYD